MLRYKEETLVPEGDYPLNVKKRTQRSVHSTEAHGVPEVSPVEQGIKIAAYEESMQRFC